MSMEGRDSVGLLKPSKGADLEEGANQGAVVMPAEKVVELLHETGVVGQMKPSKDADLELLVSRLQRSCAVLLVLSVLPLGHNAIGGLFAFLAAATVLCCSLPGAFGVARSARFAKVYAFIAAILAVHSCIVPMVALARGIPQELFEEVELRCESMDPVLAKSLVGWVHNSTQGFHERLRKDDDDDDAFSHRNDNMDTHLEDDAFFHVGEDPVVAMDGMAAETLGRKLDDEPSATPNPTPPAAWEPPTGPTPKLAVSSEPMPKALPRWKRPLADTNSVALNTKARCARLSRGLRHVATWCLAAWLLFALLTLAYAVDVARRSARLVAAAGVGHLYAIPYLGPKAITV